jgi:Transcriptional regulators
MENPCEPSPALRKEDYEALAFFRRTLRRFLHHTEDGARAAGLTPQQHQCLLAIKGQPERDWMTIGEVADALQLRHHTTVALADRCEAAGLLRREPAPQDRRQVRLYLTEQGEAILEQLTRYNLRELRLLRRALDAAALTRENAAAPDDETGTPPA